MDNIRFIKPTDLHAEMLRLHQEQQMDLSGMPDRYGLGRNNRQGYAGYTAWFRSGLSPESTTTGERLVVRTATLDRKNAGSYPVSV